MKNGYISLLIIFALFFLVGCENPSPFSNTPDEETTMLWPAGDSTGFWGFINDKGEMVIPAKFERTYGFSGGMAKVVLDDDGIPMPSYIGYQANLMGHQQAFIDKHGKILFSLPQYYAFTDHYFYYGCCRFGCVDNIGMMDTHFNPIIPDGKYSGIRLGVMTKDGLASSVLGYFNKAGELVISSHINGVDGNIYEKRDDFCDGLAVVEDYMDLNDMSLVYDRYCAINTKGEVVIDTIYKFLQSAGNDRLLYRLKNGDYHAGLIDTQGNIITEPFITIEYNSFFGDGGLMPVKENNVGANAKYGYIDKNGTLQIPYQYEYAEPFCNGYAWVRARNENSIVVCTLINLQGQKILELEPMQEPASNVCGYYHNGLCLIFDWNKPYWYYYMNLQGEVIYSWPQEPVNQKNSDRRIPEHMKPDHKELMLQRFEGTPYYPLALQCAQMKD